MKIRLKSRIFDDFSEFRNFRRGTPVDKIDKQCQDWYRCQKCISMDTNFGCDPASTMYGVLYDPIRREFVCSNQNDACQDMTCKCDVQMVNKLLQK